VEMDTENHPCYQPHESEGGLSGFDWSVSDLDVGAPGRCSDHEGLEVRWDVGDSDSSLFSNRAEYLLTEEPWAGHSVPQ